MGQLKHWLRTVRKADVGDTGRGNALEEGGEALHLSAPRLGHEYVRKIQKQNGNDHRIFCELVTQLVMQAAFFFVEAAGSDACHCCGKRCRPPSRALLLLRAAADSSS